MYNTTIINLHLYLLSSTLPFKITVFRKFFNASSSVKFSGKLPIEIRLYRRMRILMMMMLMKKYRCAFIYKCIHMHIFKYLCNKHVCIYVNMHVCMYVFVFTCVCMYAKYVYVYLYLICMNLNVSKYIYA